MSMIDDMRKPIEMEIELEELYERFGRETRLISLKQAAEYCKKDPRTLLADRTFPIKTRGKQYDVSVVRFARWLTT